MTCKCKHARKDSDMPRVGKKTFAYTPRGMKAAKKAATKKSGSKTIRMKSALGGGQAKG